MMHQSTNMRASLSFLTSILLVLLTLSCSPCLAEETRAKSASAFSSYADYEINDPYESWNRNIFAFNDYLDRNLFEPVARGYDFILPDVVQARVGNFFENLNYPRYLLSDIVSLEFDQALEHSVRFLINSTVGLAGLFDVAEGVGLPEHREDFSLALAKHGVPNGSYLVIPILGPSTTRDFFGDLVDRAVHPFSIMNYYTDIESSITDRVTYIGTSLEFVDKRAQLLDAIEAAKDASLDYYLFTQSAYYQQRRGVLYDGQPPAREGEEEWWDAED